MTTATIPEVSAFHLTVTRSQNPSDPLPHLLTPTLALSLADLIRSSAPSNASGGAPLRALGLQIEADLVRRNLLSLTPPATLP